MPNNLTLAAYEQLLRATTILKEENEPYSEPMRPTVQIFLDTATAEINRLGVTESRSILHCCAETVLRESFSVADDSDTLCEKTS